MVADLAGGASGWPYLVDRGAPPARRRSSGPIVLVRATPAAPASRRRSRPATRSSACCSPYTPLHHLLLAEAGRPLVMTSGNLSDEPMAHRDDEALERLGGIADLFLLHDRAIENRCDDSVARVIAGQPAWSCAGRAATCRAASRSGRPLARPVLACGAHLKNTFCLAAGDRPGSARTSATSRRSRRCRSFEESVARLERFLGIAPEVVAHDLHPDYFSTRYALARPEGVKIGVQHHHAHVASAMAEHGLARAGDRRGLRRHRLRDRRHGLGRRDPARRLRRLRAPGHLPAAAPGRRRHAPSARSGGSPSRCSTTPSTATRRSSACRSSRRSPPARRDGRAADDRAAGPERPARPRRGPLLRRPGRARASAGRSRATRARWPSSGTSRPTAASAGPIPSRSRTRPLPRARPAAARARRRRPTTGRALAPATISARFHNTLAARHRRAGARAPCSGWAAARRAHRGLLPERAPGRGGARRPRRASLRSASTARCRPATAGSPWVRPLVADALARRRP